MTEKDKGIDKFITDLEHTEITTSNAKRLFEKYQTISTGIQDNIARSDHNKESAKQTLINQIKRMSPEVTYIETEGIVFEKHTNPYKQICDQLYNKLDYLEDIKEELTKKVMISDKLLEMCISRMSEIDGLEIQKTAIELTMDLFNKQTAITNKFLEDKDEFQRNSQRDTHNTFITALQLIIDQLNGVKHNTNLKDLVETEQHTEELKKDKVLPLIEKYNNSPMSNKDKIDKIVEESGVSKSYVALLLSKNK